MKRFLTEESEKAMEAAEKAIRDEAEERIRQTEETIKEEEKQNMTVRRVEDMAALTRLLYDEYIGRGFTQEQAWELIKIQAACTPLYGLQYNCAV